MQALTIKSQEPQQWLWKLTECQEEILHMQNELLGALPDDASLASLSRLNELREKLIKDLEQTDNFKYNIVLMDRQSTRGDAQGSDEAQAFDRMRRHFEDFMDQFNHTREHFRSFVNQLA